MRLRWPTSLRARLLVFVLLAILATALLQAALAWRAARAEADALFDYQMRQTAQTLRAGLPEGLATGVLPVPPSQQDFDFVLQIWSVDGSLLLRSADRPELPARAVLGFADVVAHGTTYRVYSVITGGLVIQVAQDMAVRRRMAGDLALRTAAPVLWLAPVLMLAVGWLVRRTLAPVARVREQVAARSADDLAPLAGQDLPDEVRPLVQEFNGLLQRLGQAFEVQQRFVADAAHELRSPLAALKLQVQGLRRAEGVETRERALQRLDAGIDRATRLVGQLMELARQQARQAEGAPAAPLDLAALARSVIGEAVADAQARSQALGLSGLETAMVTGHADALRLLLRNLIENAIKYAPAAGRIEVGVLAGEAAGRVALVVEDSGPGIPEAERTRVLDRFYRLPDAPSTGSGLGLAIAQSVAQMHGGALRLDASPTLGGLRVRLELPAA
ncbi:ATP-binding protein [Hydrogenophaga pseudoflava]|jgi:two-component system OmpR family sensor kinase|uniref:ATP-binding protein n=1 Tax=Hydrogenophaga pseudoflava TaxID=47421 RepID=UPI0008242901|nr:ATP-binding protein [Hydrogenophaga pseudoflava]